MSADIFSDDGVVRRFLLHGGTSFVIAVYILVEAAIMAHLVSVQYGAHLYIPCLFMGLWVVAALFFESPRLATAPRPRKSSLYDHVDAGYYLNHNNGLAISMALKPKEYYNKGAVKEGVGAYWHPLTEFECKECYESVPTHVQRPPRARHCYVCNTCTVALDHHCEFVNACIGEGNYPAFVCFLIWSFSGLAAHKVVEFVLFIASLFCYFDISSQNEWFMSLLTAGMTRQGIQRLNEVQLLDIIFLLADIITGCIVAGLIGMLFYQQLLHLLNNCTWPEYAKYTRNKAPMPYDYGNDSLCGRVLAIYLNIRHRVWNGRGNGPSDSLVNMVQAFSNQRLVRHPWKSVYIIIVELLHTWACFVLPQYWWLSGEHKQHNDYAMLLKHSRLPNNDGWTFNMKQYINKL